MLFQHTLRRNTFECALGLLEEILAVRTKTFNLAYVPNAEEIILSMSPVQLASFCRVLALLVFEPELQAQRTCWWWW